METMMKPGLVSAMDWRAEIKIEAREKVFKAILGKLKECSSPFRPYDMYMEKIVNHAREQEMKLLKTAKSKEQYYSGLARMLNGSENTREIASNQDHPAVITKKEAFDGQPLPQMTNQPHQWVVRNSKNQQPAVPCSLLKPNIPELMSQPHVQFYERKLNARQTNQSFGVHNQRCVSPHNALNSPRQPQGVQSRVLETPMTPEFVTQHPEVVKLQPNENLSAKVKEEVIHKDFNTLTYIHDQLSAIEQHKQRQSLGAAVPNGNSNAEEWHGQALSELQHLRKYLPVLKKIYEKRSERLLQVTQIELMQKYEHQKNRLQMMIKFLELPDDRIFILCHTKDGFYRRVQGIWKHVEIFFVNWSISLAKKQQPLVGQPSLSQYHINPVQQCDNMNPHFQLVNLATTGSYDSSSPRAPQEIGSLSSEAGCVHKCMLQKKQTENIKQEFHSSWIQQNQKSTENIKASNRSGMCLEYHLNSKISPETIEASKLSKIAEQALSINPSATLYERASPIPPSSTVGLGKNPTNASNSQCSQGCNSLKLHASKLSKIAEQALPINPSATFCERASPIPPSSTVGLGKDPTNPSNSQCSQGCNSLKLHASMLSKIVQQAVPINPSATLYERASPIPPSSTVTLGKDPTNPSNSQCSQGCNSLNLHVSKLSKIAEQSLLINLSTTLYERASPIPSFSTVGLGKDPTNPSNSQCSQGRNSFKLHVSKGSKITEQALPINSSATLYVRASPIPPSSTVGLGKDLTNPSNSQCSQGCNSLKLHVSKLSKIAGQALPINSSATLYERASPIPPFSTVELDASKLSEIAKQGPPINPSATLYERVSPILPSTVGLGKDPTNNPSNSHCSQGCNSLKLHDSRTEIQVQSRENKSSSKMTCQLAEPTTNLGNKVQFPTVTPQNRLLKAVESISHEALGVAVSEISSVTEDRITEPWCCETETYLSFQDGCGFTSNLKRKINATNLNDMPSPCSAIDESELLVTSSYKKLKKMSDHAILEEMRKINSQFIETVLELDTDEKFNRQWAHAGTVIRLSYRAATESKNTVLHSANKSKLTVLSIKLILHYPDHYPVLLSKFDTAYGAEDDVLKRMSREAGLLLRRFLDANHDYLSLEDYAKAWNECARSVVSDYAKCAGGGSFSSRYGNWEDCFAAA